MPDLVEKFFSEDLTEAEEQALENSLWSSEDEAERFVQFAEKAYYRYGFPKPQWPGAPDSPSPAGSGFKPWMGLSIFVLGTAATFFWQRHPGIPFSNLFSSLKTIHGASSPSPGFAVGGKGQFSSLSQEVLNNDHHSSAKISGSSSKGEESSAPDSDKKAKSSLRAGGSSVGQKAAEANPENKGSSTPANNLRTQPIVVPFNLDETPSKNFSSVSVEVHLAEPGSVAVRVLDMSGVEVTPLYAGNLTTGHWVFEWDGQLGKGRHTQPGYYQIEVKSGTYVGRKNIHIR